MTPPSIRYKPFREMRATIALLETAIVMVIAVLDIEKLDLKQKLLIATIMAARSQTANFRKSNPTRFKMLTVCGSWYRWAQDMQPLIPADQAQIQTAFQKALDDAHWVSELDPNLKRSEVNS